jgi:hypothetical protein
MSILFSISLFVFCSQVSLSELVNIALIGDSLLRHPANDWNLIPKLQANLPEFNLNFTVYAKDGSTIFDVKTGQLLQSLNDKPDGYILFWDSDCSDINESVMAPLEIDALRLRYEHNVNFVVSSIKDSGAFLATAGPEILGKK